jgi:IclR family pca regulon transcriptional regulator
MPSHKSRHPSKKPRSSASAEATDAVLPPASVELDIFSGDPNFMTSLARGLAVIQAFSGRRRHLSISCLSQKTGFSRAAVRRCLYTLLKLGFVGSEDNRHFFLQPRILSLGHSYISSMPLATAAQPILEHVSHLVRESCSIAILDGQDIIYIARVNVTRIMGIHLGVGSRLPAFCTSMGRALLANLSREDLESYVSKVQFTRYTERTVGSKDALLEKLEEVRRSGYAIVDQELELGLRSMAVPIQNLNGLVVAAVNVGAHAQRVSVQEMQQKFLPHLQTAAQELSMLLR